MTRSALFIHALVCALTFVSAMPAWAEKADKNKPLNVEADSLVQDDLKQVSVLSGTVILSKGTMAIRAHHVELRKDTADHQFMVATAKPNERVFFRIKREGLDEFMEGEAERVSYDGKADTATFSGKAALRRLRGASLADEALGNVIVYSNVTETLTINGSPAKGNTPAQRVRMMITPKTAP